MSDNTIGFEIENPVSVWNRDIKIDLKTFFATLGKMTVSFISYDGKGVEANVIDLLKDAGLKNNPAQIAWLLIFQSLKQSLVELIEEYQNLFNQTTNDDKLKEFAENIANELNTLKVIITPQFFDRPQDLPLLENLKPALIQWLLNLGLTDIQANTIHARLKTKFVLSLHQQWLAKPSDYAVVKEAIDTPFTQANQKLQSWHQYNAWLQEQINQRMFDEAFGLNQVYVPLRAYYHIKDEDCVEHDIERNTDKPKPIVIDLKTHLTEWVNNFNKDDCIRVVSGGPGSGKSSFGKMFAAHIAELKTIPVLFIPLHHFDPSADLISAVNQFVASDRFLTGTPLDAKGGESPLLLIFDGLDELSMQGKASAAVSPGWAESPR